MTVKGKIYVKRRNTYIFFTHYNIGISQLHQNILFTFFGIKSSRQNYLKKIRLWSAPQTPPPFFLENVKTKAEKFPSKGLYLAPPPTILPGKFQNSSFKKCSSKSSLETLDSDSTHPPLIPPLAKTQI